ncbi:uncharacterized protein LOC120634385 [Pararge aegeria]|uniref:uncharacterized protein LOC120634385 n=1 Tax=Pararge aegeria TaxID=116150 RepID=UPI0019D249E8|nr:uncharacterized protein LOC120634385 [Pararge aegeria]
MKNKIKKYCCPSDVYNTEQIPKENNKPNQSLEARRLNFYARSGNQDFGTIPGIPEAVFSCSAEKNKNDVCTELTDVSNFVSSSKTKTSTNANSWSFDKEWMTKTLKSMNFKDIKIAISERFLHLRMKNPLPMMRELYSTLLEASSKVMKGKQENTRKETDAEVEVLTQTCTCATQYIQISDKTCSCMKVDKNLIKEFGDTANIEEYSTDITESSVTLSTISLTDETKTDTTECNRVAIDFEVSPRRGKPKRNVRKIKVEFITKANQGTATDKAKLCDVSTITSDWWSPLVDRKHGKVHLSSGEMYKSIEHSGLYSDRSVSADGKIVTFKSRAQMIPPDKGDILSPSRYLLESQKYYNELFSPNSNIRSYPMTGKEKQGQLKG